MPEIKTVAILGAGAVGGYFASRFACTPELSTILIADGERYQRLSQDGLVVNGVPVFLPVVRSQEAQSPVDLLIVALKGPQLKDALPSLAQWVGEQTTLIPMMNGLDSEAILGAVYGMEKVLYAISLGIDSVREGNRITYTNPGKHVFGEAQNLTITPKVKRVQEAFTKAGIQYDTPVDMMRMLWWKFLINVGINQASVILRASYRVFQTNLDAQAVMESLMQEVVTLAKAEKVNLTEEDIRGWYPIMNQMSPVGKTSMLQDVEARRKTEVEVFGGKMIELGKAHGIPVPANQMAFHIIRAIEQGYL